MKANPQLLPAIMGIRRCIKACSRLFRAPAETPPELGLDIVTLCSRRVEPSAVATRSSRQRWTVRLTRRPIGNKDAPPSARDCANLNLHRDRPTSVPALTGPPLALASAHICAPVARTNGIQQAMPRDMWRRKRCHATRGDATCKDRTWHAARGSGTPLCAVAHNETHGVRARLPFVVTCAEKGHAAAQVTLGECCAAGIGRSPWLRRACACVRVGLCVYESWFPRVRVQRRGMMEAMACPCSIAAWSE